MTADSEDRRPGKTESRLAKHLQVLGLENHGLSDKDLADEVNGMAAMQPPPLDLPAPSSRRQVQPAKSVRRPWYGIGAIAAAAMLAVMVYVNREDDGYRVKGASQVLVYTETSGSVQEWDKKSPLASGVRVRVEFKAHENMVAFVGVKDGKGRDLFSPELIWSRRLTLTAGQVAVSEGSIELTGTDDDETLVAVSCPVADAPAAFSEFSRFWADIGKPGHRCVIEQLRFR